MSIASAFNEITVAHGGSPSNSGAITDAIDALNDALAGSDQQGARDIEGAIRLLGAHIGGGSSVTVEALTATENKTYTAPEGKAYSPVTVNVSGGGTEYNIYCYSTEDYETFTPISDTIIKAVFDDAEGYWVESGSIVNKAAAGEMLTIHKGDDDTKAIEAVFAYPPSSTAAEYPTAASLITMPQADVSVIIASDK